MRRLGNRQQNGQRLKAWRLSRGLSQRRLGELAGIRQQTIAEYEAGACEPTPGTRRALAAALRVYQDVLFGGGGE